MFQPQKSKAMQNCTALLIYLTYFNLILNDLPEAWVWAPVSPQPVWVPEY